MAAELQRLRRQILSGEGSDSREEHERKIRVGWQKDPYVWARDRLKLRLLGWHTMVKQAYREHVWDGTKEPLKRAAEALGDGRSAVISSGTGLGKTFLAAVLVLWFLDCWWGSQVITLAPKEDQLKQLLWKEIGRLWPLFKKLHPKAQLKSLAIVMRPGLDIQEAQPGEASAGWGALGYAVGVDADEVVAGRARGFHAEHMLFILEEGNAIHEAIVNAVEFTCTAPHNLRLMLGNPDSDQDSLAKAARDPAFTAIRASALDFPNVVANDHTLIPGGASRSSVDRIREKYGEDNRLFLSRVRGIAPGEAADALIRREWLVICRSLPPERMAELSRGPGALGCDLGASEGGDQGAWCYGVGAVVASGPIGLGSAACPDPNAFARQRFLPYLESGMVEARRCGVDAVGVGQGAMGELRRLSYEVQALHGGQWEPYLQDGEKFNSLRCQMWWQARLDIFHKRVVPPDDPELWDDLTTPLWWIKKGTIWVEAKEVYRGRLGRSPNRGDAFVYWNWVRQREGSVSFSIAETRPVSL